MILVGNTFHAKQSGEFGPIKHFPTWARGFAPRPLHFTVPHLFYPGLADDRNSKNMALKTETAEGQGGAGRAGKKAYLLPPGLLILLACEALETDKYIVRSR